MVIVTMPLGIWLALLPIVITWRIARWTLRVAVSAALHVTRLAVRRLAQYARRAA